MERQRQRGIGHTHTHTHHRPHSTTLMTAFRLLLAGNTVGATAKENGSSGSTHRRMSRLIRDIDQLTGALRCQIIPADMHIATYCNILLLPCRLDSHERVRTGPDWALVTLIID